MKEIFPHHNRNTLKRVFLVICLIISLRAASWDAAPYSLAELESAPVALIPYPRKVDWKAGQTWQVPQSLRVYASEKSLSSAVLRTFSPWGISLVDAPTSEAADLVLRIDPAVIKQAEGYQLRVTTKGATITGHDAPGVFYGLQTLHQLLRGMIGKAQAAACEITDAPAFSVRGFMHDTGRNFQSIESLKRQLDHFAAYKLNVFHWHLTDNPAWRPESRIFPQLNDPKFRKEGRDPEKSYTFEQIRDLIGYARERHIRIIPELDMPGHSAYFPRTFGFAMETTQGMEVLEKLIDEFCAEIPQTDCPIIHLGADEVKIAEPSVFIKRMTDRLRKNGREAILWNPGLKPINESTTVQIWGDQSAHEKQAQLKNPVIDSAGGYLNSFDPLHLPLRYFFWQPCGQAQGDATHLGGILCMWADIRVDDKRNIFQHSPVWPTVLAFSESIWQGRSQAYPQYQARCPDHGTEAWHFYREFETRMADHRGRFFAEEPFPWIKQSSVQWRMRNVTNNPSAPWKKITGTTVQIADTKLPVGTVLEMQTVYQLDTPRTVPLWIGFDFIARSHRESGGIPEQGKWDANGCEIFINGQPIPAPVWKNPGKYRYEKPTWEQPANEIPLSDEELYWCRPPVFVSLKKGNNLIQIKLRKAYMAQTLQATCAPVKSINNKWIEDESIRNLTEP